MVKMAVAGFGGTVRIPAGISFIREVRFALRGGVEDRGGSRSAEKLWEEQVESEARDEVLRTDDQFA